MTEGSTTWCSREHGKGTPSAGCSGWVVDLTGSLKGRIVCGQQRRREGVSREGHRGGKAGGAARVDWVGPASGAGRMEGQLLGEK